MKQFNEYEESESARRKGIYLLPNLFTTAGLFAGFYAIVASMKGLFIVAAIATFIAMLADSLDGRVARLTNTQSEFGAEYDSLSDMVAFGIAPALLVYSWALHSFGKIGWLIAFFYAAATALRLARFNVAQESKHFFTGLPCPSAAAILTGMIWVVESYHLHRSFIIQIIAALLTVIVGVLMVSNVKYHSLKDVDMKGKVPFMFLLIIIAFFVAIALDPPEVLFSVFFIYLLSGPIFFLLRLRKKQELRIVDKGE